MWSLQESESSCIVLWGVCQTLQILCPWSGWMHLFRIQALALNAQYPSTKRWDPPQEEVPASGILPRWDPPQEEVPASGILLRWNRPQEEVPGSGILPLEELGRESPSCYLPQQDTCSLWRTQRSRYHFGRGDRILTRQPAP